MAARTRKIVARRPAVWDEQEYALIDHLLSNAVNKLEPKDNQGTLKCLNEKA